MAYRRPLRYGQAGRMEQVVLARGIEDGLRLAADAPLSCAAAAGRRAGNLSIAVALGDLVRSRAGVPRGAARTTVLRRGAVPDVAGAG